MRDQNQIAAGILLQATLTEPKPGESPGLRLRRAISVTGGAASVAKVPMEQRQLNGLKGAIFRWGTIRERDNSVMPASRKNLDLNQLAKRILDEATGDEPKTEQPQIKNHAAVELGKLGGQKGGAARTAALSTERRKEIAKKAAEARWKK